MAALNRQIDFESHSATAAIERQVGTCQFLNGQNAMSMSGLSKIGRLLPLTRPSCLAADNRRVHPRVRKIRLDFDQMSAQECSSPVLSTGEPTQI